MTLTTINTKTGINVYKVHDYQGQVIKSRLFLHTEMYIYIYMGHSPENQSKL